MNALKILALTGALLLHALLPANATPKVIQDDNGGVIVRYIKRFSDARDSGETVIIDGGCYSACTLVLGIVPRDKICFTDKAVMGFHSATNVMTFPDGREKRKHDVEFSELMFDILPTDVRKMLKMAGWDADENPEKPHDELIRFDSRTLIDRVGRKCTATDWKP